MRLSVVEQKFRSPLKSHKIAHLNPRLLLPSSLLDELRKQQSPSVPNKWRPFNHHTEVKFSQGDKIQGLAKRALEAFNSRLI